MKKVYILSLLLFLTASNIFSQSGWFQLSSPTNINIQASWFVSNDTGFIGIDSGKIYRTVNGGLNWTLISVPTTGYMLEMFFLNSYIGYTLFYYTNDQYRIFKSTNKGLNWSSVSVQYTTNPQDIYFVNEFTGFVANSSNILRTT